MDMGLNIICAQFPEGVSVVRICVVLLEKTNFGTVYTFLATKSGSTSVGDIHIFCKKFLTNRKTSFTITLLCQKKYLGLLHII